RRPDRGLRGDPARRGGVVHAAPGAVAQCSGHALRARGGRRFHAFRVDRRPAQDPGRDRQGLRRHPRAHPADREQDDVQAPPPLALPSPPRLPRLTFNPSNPPPPPPPPPRPAPPRLARPPAPGRKSDISPYGRTPGIIADTYPPKPGG